MGSSLGTVNRYSRFFGKVTLSIAAIGSFTVAEPRFGDARSRPPPKLNYAPDCEDRVRRPNGVQTVPLDRALKTTFRTAAGAPRGDWLRMASIDGSYAPLTAVLRLSGRATTSHFPFI